MKMLPVILFSFSICALASCQEKESQNPYPDVQLTKSETQVVHSGNVFGFDLLKAVANDEADSVNIMISPFSVATALAMTYNGANAETKVAMEEALRMQGLSTSEINLSYQHLIDILENMDPNVLMEIANSIWYHQDYYVNPAFILTNQSYYDAEVTALDFSDPASVNVINHWVASKTHNLIPFIINNIPANTLMYLINAVYFKGTWTYQFQAGDTSPLPFYTVDGGTVEVPTMKQGGAFRYFSDEELEAVELPYGDERFSMVVLVPKFGNTANGIIQNLDTLRWNQITASLVEVPEVHVYLPKFKFAYEKKLNEVLSLMGMGIAFGDSADFTGIDPQGGLFLSKVLHKSFIDVNEEGTEAAAATVVEVSFESVPDYVDFRANRPFVFAIREKSTGAVVFAGKVAKPQL